MAAFVTSALPLQTSSRPSISTSSFHGTRISATTVDNIRARITARYNLADYAKYNDDVRAPSEELVPPTSSQPSSWWVAYRDSLKGKTLSSRETADINRGRGVALSEVAILSATTPYFEIVSMIDGSKFATGGDEHSINKNLPARRADTYMAMTIRSACKSVGVSNGVYNPQCTEGSVKGAAEEARVSALAAEFRSRQRSVAARFGDLFENRRRAYIATCGCDYEEALVNRYSRSAEAYVIAKSEMVKACERYATPRSAAEKYMAGCVTFQGKMQGAGNGVYGVECCDGNVKGSAESVRVRCLAVKYRNSQKSQGQLLSEAFEVRKYARENYSGMCSYEEALFNKFPAVAASMRPKTARY